MTTPKTVLRHEFVEFIPEALKEGVLYVSIAYATIAHKCCCGCGHEVVTPLTPTDWKLIFDGESVSLDPSIGNWSFPCQSHYWIRRNRVQWAERWSRERVEAGRSQDTDAKSRHFTERAPQISASPQPSSESRSATKLGFWQQLSNWIGGR
jgi:hypothetical protein